MSLSSPQGKLKIGQYQIRAQTVHFHVLLDFVARRDAHDLEAFETQQPGPAPYIESSASADRKIDDSQDLPSANYS